MIHITGTLLSLGSQVSSAQFDEAFQNPDIGGLADPVSEYRPVIEIGIVIDDIFMLKTTES